MYWEKYTHEKIKEVVFSALKQNLDYREKPVLGLPASYLDSKVFYDDAPFLADAPFLSALIANPNHIGCHTLSEDSEPFFKGTQQIEGELIKLCAEEILGGKTDEQDGYVAPGGTEANIQAMWCYRNYFRKEFKAGRDEICLIYSEDSHYSMPKGANVLDIESAIIPVNFETRKWDLEAFQHILDELKRLFCCELC